MDNPNLLAIKVSPLEAQYWDTKNNRLITLVKIGVAAVVSAVPDIAERAVDVLSTRRLGKLADAGSKLLASVFAVRSSKFVRRSVPIGLEDPRCLPSDPLSFGSRQASGAALCSKEPMVRLGGETSLAFRNTNSNLYRDQLEVDLPRENECHGPSHRSRDLAQGIPGRGSLRRSSLV